MDKKKGFSAEYKAKIAIETLREANTPSEIANRGEINVKQVYNWRKALMDGAILVFGQSKAEREMERSIKDMAAREEELMAKVGRLTVENDWLKKIRAAWRQRIGASSSCPWMHFLCASSASCSASIVRTCTIFRRR
jgi:transposase-like protein